MGEKMYMYVQSVVPPRIKNQNDFRTIQPYAQTTTAPPSEGRARGIDFHESLWPQQLMIICASCRWQALVEVHDSSRVMVNPFHAHIHQIVCNQFEWCHRKPNALKSATVLCTKSTKHLLYSLLSRRKCTNMCKICTCTINTWVPDGKQSKHSFSCKIITSYAFTVKRMNPFVYVATSTVNSGVIVNPLAVGMAFFLMRFLLDSPWQKVQQPEDYQTNTLPTTARTRDLKQIKQQFLSFFWFSFFLSFFSPNI